MTKLLHHLIQQHQTDDLNEFIKIITNQLIMKYPIYDDKHQLKSINADANATWQEVLFGSSLVYGHDYIESIMNLEDNQHHYPEYIDYCKQILDLGVGHWFIIDTDIHLVRRANYEDIQILATKYAVTAALDGTNFQSWNTIPNSCSETLCEAIGM